MHEAPVSRSVGIRGAMQKGAAAKLVRRIADVEASANVGPFQVRLWGVRNGTAQDGWALAWVSGRFRR